MKAQFNLFHKGLSKTTLEVRYRITCVSTRMDGSRMGYTVFVMVCGILTFSTGTMIKLSRHHQYQ